MGYLPLYTGLGAKPSAPDADDLARDKLDAKKLEREERKQQRKRLRDATKGEH